MVGKFSIKDLEKISGIKAHTLRIWEQRYGILKPERTDTNIRWYCNSELKTLLNIAMLNNNGFKISKIATLSEKEISEEVTKIVDKQSLQNEQIDGLIIAMVEMDEQRFEKIISNSILCKTFTCTMEEIIYPFLHKIGVMWHTGSINPAQEHFISNLIRQKLIVAIDAQHVTPTDKTKKFILFLRDGELHELSLLYYCYLLKSKGHQVVYLGQSVPLLDVQKVFEICKPDYIVSLFTNAMDEPEKFIKQMAKPFSKIKLLISGIQISGKKIKTPANVLTFKDPKELLSHIS